jgi:hypothetical protein
MKKRERKMAESVVKRIQAKFINKCVENLSFHKQIERATESIIKSYDIGNDFMASVYEEELDVLTQLYFNNALEVGTYMINLGLDKQDYMNN